MAEKIFHYTERAIVMILMFLMLVVVSLSTVELIITIITQIIGSGETIASATNLGDDDAYNNPALFLDIDELLTYFGLFFMILIGLELLETIKMYLKDDQIHVELVMLVALIAVGRKVILLDLKQMEPMAIIGLALIIISLATSYYIIRKVHPDSQNKNSQLGHSSAQSESK